MNVLERTREIGIMRAVGASDRTIMSMVLLEGLIIGLISWVLGSLLSFPISNFMSNGINQALFGASTDFQFSPVGFFVWLIFAIVLSIVASVMPARNAARLTIREVLAYE
jgi:putative ABC transport system permease protein